MPPGIHTNSKNLIYWTRSPKLFPIPLLSPTNPVFLVAPPSSHKHLRVRPIRLVFQTNPILQLLGHPWQFENDPLLPTLFPMSYAISNMEEPPWYCIQQWQRHDRCSRWRRIHNLVYHHHGLKLLRRNSWTDHILIWVQMIWVVGLLQPWWVLSAPGRWNGPRRRWRFGDNLSRPSEFYQRLHRFGNFFLGNHHMDNPLWRWPTNLLPHLFVSRWICEGSEAYKTKIDRFKDV